LAGDAEQFIAAAEHHNVMTYALAAIEAGRLELPESAAAGLHRQAAVRALHARLLREELPSVVEAIERACAVPPVVIKGPAVADRYYRAPSLRPFVDMDLILPREALEPAAAGLRAHGYEAVVEFRPGFTQLHGHDVHLARYGAGPRLDVELHWRVGDDPVTAGLDHPFLRAGAERLSVGGRDVIVPRKARQLITLAAHLLSDRARRLSWVHDLKLIATACSPEEWREAFTDAERIGLSWVLHRALDYPERYLGLRRARPTAPGPPPRFGPLRAAEQIYGPAALHLGRLAGLSWRQRAGYLRAVLVPTRAGMERTVGADGAATWRLAARHAARSLRMLKRFDE
jgi:hypothetical protein